VARLAPCDVAHQLTKSRGAIEQRGALLRQHATRLGESRAFAPSSEQRHVEVPLQLLHVRGHRRLRVVERLRGSTKRAVPHDGAEGGQVPQFHGDCLYHDSCTVCFDHFV
jgi:hypothetical protein